MDKKKHPVYTENTQAKFLTQELLQFKKKDFVTIIESISDNLYIFSLEILI